MIRSSSICDKAVDGGNHAAPESIAQCVATTLHRHGSVWLRVNGGSMLPWIRPGDILFIREAAFEEVSRGEVVLYCRDGRLFVHRILTRIAGQGIVAGRKFVLTKGDALSQADAPLSSDELLGLVLEIHRGRRHWDCASSGYTALARFLARFSFLGRISYLFARATQMIFFSSRKSEADPSRAAASENQLGACEMTLASPLRD